jgi:hypothetical protein
MAIIRDDHHYTLPYTYEVKDADNGAHYIETSEFKQPKSAYEGGKGKFPRVKEKAKKEQKQSWLSILVKKKIIFGHILVFAPQKSPCLSDLMSIAMSDKVKVQVFDPLLPYGGKEPHIEQYDFVVIADVLERLPNRMSRASIVKEALISLLTDSIHACVVLAVRNKQTVEKMDEEEKDGLKMIEGIEKDELKSIAIFAGAKSTWSIKELEEEGVSYIGASFSNRKQR